MKNRATAVGIIVGWCSPMTPRNPDLIDALRVTLRKLEESGEFSPQEPSLLRLKSSILLLIADLENKRQEDGDELAA